MLKNREKIVLAELLVSGRKPDKHIAKARKISQPTVTRIRQKLEREKYIESYHATPAFKKLGLNIIVVTTFTWNDYSKREVVDNAVNDMTSNPKVMFLSRGNGFSGKTAVMISMHSDISGYEEFLVGLKSKWGKYMDGVDQFVSSTENIFKPFEYQNAVMDVIGIDVKKDKILSSFNRPKIRAVKK
ncbi:MAG: Lrp/AsnC family transcriptional regulator [Candidatus Aenigmarchaeota archaeon]|nr:Lrp/AsnC family transcriptional regulator [Candidatus Aenigmarchaeota archaeon]